MSSPLEKDLIKGAQVFDQSSLGMIYDRYSARLYSYALRLLGDENLAQDCVSETFSRFLKALRDGKGPQEYLQAYLYRIAHNWITDIYRRQPPPPLELLDSIQTDDHNRMEMILDRQTEREQLRAALIRLTPDQRQVIILKFIEGWDNEQIAASLQKPSGTIRVLTHRALSILRKLLLLEDKEGVYGL